MEQVKKGRSFTYTINGEPEALVLRRSEDITGWNNHKHKKLIVDISLESQHDDRPLFSGKLELEVQFYFYIPHGVRAKIRAVPGQIHDRVPSLLLLANFLEHSAKGIVWADTAHFARMNYSKMYDDNPRTVITVTELHEKK